MAVRVEVIKKEWGSRGEDVTESYTLKHGEKKNIYLSSSKMDSDSFYINVSVDPWSNDTPTCAICDKPDEGYHNNIDDHKYRKREFTKEAIYDTNGYNQWGTRYSNECKHCGSHYPTNMVGMGICQYCLIDYNPMAG